MTPLHQMLNRLRFAQSMAMHIMCITRYDSIECIGRNIDDKVQYNIDDQMEEKTIRYVTGPETKPEMKSLFRILLVLQPFCSNSLLHGLPFDNFN